MSLPLTPRKQIVEIQSNPVPPSPDMKQARNRLDNLLSGIRTGDSQSALAYREEQAYKIIDVDDTEETKRGPGRPKKQRREKRVVFELRGKSFGIRDVEQSESIYSLCRKWMYGKDDELKGPEEVPPPLPHNVSLDLLATKPIYSFPGPVYNAPSVSSYPPELPEFQSQLFKKGQPEPSIEETLREHVGHWKNVKRCFNEHTEKRKTRYAPSIQLLNTVYGIAQQTQ